MEDIIEPFETDSFDYVNLSDIDPNQELVPEGLYTFKILKTEFTTGVSKSTNKPYERVKLTVAIQDDDTYSGRRFWPVFFKNNGSLKQLRKLMDATGVPQLPGMTLTDWLNELQVVQPSFKTLLTMREDRDGLGNVRSFDYKGEPQKVNRVDFWRCVPAD